MSTVRDNISLVRTRHKLLSADNLISDRTIADELRNKAIKLIRQQTNLRKLWATDTIFTTIPCLEMEPVPLAECCDYRSPANIARSVLQLPKIAEGYYQYLIQGVFDVENSRKLTYLTPSRYINIRKLRTRIPDIYYWISNNYIYVTDEDIESIKVIAFFEDDLPLSILYPDCGCCSSVPPAICTNPLDLEFKCPGYLQEDVINMASQALLTTYFRTVPDYTQDNKDDETIR